MENIKGEKDDVQLYSEILIEMESTIDSMQKAATDKIKMDTFLEKCHEKMKYVDKSVASLMNSLDMVHATTEMLVKQLDVPIENGEEPPKDVIQTLQECKRTAKELIMMLEGTVLREKVTTVESLRSFLHFIMKNAEGNASVRTVSSCYLLLDAEYSNVSHKHKEKYIQSLLNENGQLLREISVLNELIRLSDEKERTFMAEKKSQNKKIKSLEVQLYCLKSGPQIAMVVQEVMSLLNTDERLGNENLTFTLCEHQTDIQAKSPLLVLCFNTSGIATDVMNTLKGIPKSGKTAILIFHHKDEHALPNQSSLRVLVNPEFQNFGGIFDMAFLSGKGIYSCKMNTDALNGIMEFLTKILNGDVV